MISSTQLLVSPDLLSWKQRKSKFSLRNEIYGYKEKKTHKLPKLTKFGLKNTQMGTCREAPILSRVGPIMDVTALPGHCAPWTCRRGQLWGPHHSDYKPHRPLGERDTTSRYERCLLWVPSGAEMHPHHQAGPASLLNTCNGPAKCEVKVHSTVLKA